MNSKVLDDLVWLRNRSIKLLAEAVTEASGLPVESPVWAIEERADKLIKLRAKAKALVQAVKELKGED